MNLHLPFRTGLCALFSMLVAMPFASGREWKDKTGHYRVEAELVSANEELVVLRTASHKLLAIEIEQLSQSDQDFVRATMVVPADGAPVKPLAPKPLPPTAAPPGEPPVPASEDNSAPPAVASVEMLEDKPEPAPVPEVEAVDPGIATKSPLPTAATDNVAVRALATAGGWRLVDGTRVMGEFMGFDLEPLVIKRANGEIFVGDTRFKQLDPIYQEILPKTVAYLQNAKIADVKDLEKWLKQSGPGPWTYKLEAVRIETPSHGTVSLPIFLLDKRTAESVSIPLRRWREALSVKVAEQDRNRYFARERFLTRAAMTAQLADSQVGNQADYQRLELLSAASGATDLWAVQLYPPEGYGYPYEVIVPGLNSDEASAVAMQRYPGYVLGGVARRTW